MEGAIESIVRYKGYHGLSVREICRCKAGEYMVLSNVRSAACVVN
jgi:hypothetical protein